MVESFNQDFKLHVLGELQGGEVDWTSEYKNLFDVVGYPKGKILDVGSNESRLRGWLGDEQSVVSLDIRCLKRVDVRATARALPFGDSSFDMVTALYSVPIFAKDVQRATMLEEMIRVSKESVLVWPLPFRWVFKDYNEAFDVGLRGTYGELTERARCYIEEKLDHCEVSAYEIPSTLFPFDAMAIKIKKLSN